MTSAATIQRGRGIGRDPWAIRAYLSTIKTEQGKRFSMAEVARRAKVKPQVAQDTIAGFRNHKRVLEILEGLKCPAIALYGQAEPTVRAA